MKYLFLACFLFQTLCLATESFSEEAWKRISRTYQEIKDHPFNRELKNGALPKDKFESYSNQDAHYLQVFAKALAQLAAKVDDKEMAGALLDFAKESLQEGGSPKGEMNLGTFTYTNYLIAQAAGKGSAEIAATLLPCFWIYFELAKDLKPLSSKSNPYYNWLETYSSEKYETSVKKMIQITDRLASTIPDWSPLFKAFETASWLEWYFWEASYKSITFPGFNKPRGSKTDLMPLNILSSSGDLL